MTDLPALDTLLESLSKDDNVTQRAVSIILNHESFKSQISDIHTTIRLSILIDKLINTIAFLAGKPMSNYT